MKYFKKNIKPLLALTIIVLLISSWLVYFSKPKIYNSESMKISFEVPAESSIEDKFASIAIKNKKGEILINRNGTNFDNLNDYMYSLDGTRRNQISLDLEEKKIISGYESLVRIYPAFEGNNKTKNYYLFVNNWVFLLSTSSEASFSDLDQIAQSFKYIGN